MLSTVALQASDYYRSVDTPLRALVLDSVSSVCEEGETHVLLHGQSLCVDTYEAAPTIDCPFLDPQSQTDTLINRQASDCQARSVAAVTPWRFVSYMEAQHLCAQQNKRLLTNAEWHALALAQQDIEHCALSQTKPTPTGETDCVTAAGIHDLVGNVWEWVGGEIVDGRVASRTLPLSGYVSRVDQFGLVVETLSDPQDIYDKDYAWTSADGVRGILRGGFYDSGEDGGIYAQNLSVPLEFWAAGVGFRCVREIKGAL